MPEQVRQQKEALFGRYRIIDMDLRAIQIAGQRIRDVPGDNLDAVRAGYAARPSGNNRRTESRCP
jgi:hypothetical protein